MKFMTLNSTQKNHHSRKSQSIQIIKSKTSLKEPPTDLELKPLSDNLEYVFLEEPSFLLVIISSQLTTQNKSKLVYVLKRHKEAFAWKTTDIPGICLSFCKHKIQLLDTKKPVVQKQRRLNPNMQEVVKKEIMKLLDTGIIYQLMSPWVSIHCVPKKGGITVVTNENDELVLTRTNTGWRVCIDYCKLNEAIEKDHFLLPFMDQMLERLTGNKYFCFLDGFSGYFQIPIDPNDQEKITFTCPFGTYAYRQMPFGLCNAPATFQSFVKKLILSLIGKMSLHGQRRNCAWTQVIMEYLVELDEKARILELKWRYLKITVLTTNTLQYAVFKLYGKKIFWEISNVVPTPRNSNTPYPTTWIQEKESRRGLATHSNP
ncbi:reverse transcriptase domain-containing protein [Tanacetum coccineum]